MLQAKRDSSMLMDLHSHYYPQSRSSSFSVPVQSENVSAAAAANVAAAHRRRSSASQIIPIVSQALLAASATGTRRSPLAPLDPQFSSFVTHNKDFGSDMAHDDPYQPGRKSSITLTNATRPTPYVQRNLPRRYTNGQRRTSLPALHPSHEPPPPLPPLPPANPVSPHELASAHDDDIDIYSRLSTFTFGDVRSPTILQNPSSSSRSDEAEGVSPLDKTPRPSVAHVHVHSSGKLAQGKHAAPNGWSSPSEDEEDRKRTNTRSKMRAIDDGTRRPSLPSNDSLQQLQLQSQHHGSSSGLSTDKGKGRVYTEGDREGLKARKGIPVSPSSPTEGEAELDTDVDLMMSADDTDRRRRGRYHGMSDRSSVHMSSDVGSVYGGADDRHTRHTESKGKAREGGESTAMDEDDVPGEGGASNASRKDSARTWTEETGRRGSLPMDIPYPTSNSSARSAHVHGDREGLKARKGIPVSPSSPTEGEAELDTDVDLMMSADDTDRRRRGRYHGMSDRSSVHMSSDVGSVYGGADDRHTQHTKSKGKAREGGESTTMDDDVPGEGGASNASRKDSARTWTEETGRRGSLPMDIPYPTSNSSARSAHVHAHPQSSYREESAFDAHARAQAQLRRPSRSVDDDLQRAALHLQRKASRVSVTASAAGSGHGLETAGSGPSSEPDMRGVAMAQAIAQAHLDAQAQAHAESLNLGTDVGNTSDEPYQGLDLNYILSVSGPQGSAASVGGKRGSDQWSGRLSVGSSVAAAGRERDPSWAAGWGISHSVGRRQSTATVNDDTFLRFVKKHDFSYDERKREWTFMRERTEDTGHVPSRAGQEIWRCLWVGRYKVDRVHSKNAEPSKPLQVRLNIRHLPDPYTKASTRGGPLTFIHKHSRAQAFSIFRGHSLPQRHLKTSSSILLAPKKVQEQFTSTRTTSKLSTHGLLDEKDSGTNTASSSRRGEQSQTASGSGTNSATTSTTSVSGTSHVHNAHTAPSSSATVVGNASAASTGSKTSVVTSSAGDHHHQHQHGPAGKLKLRIDKKESIESTSTSTSMGDRKGKSVLRSPVEGPPSASQASMSMSELTSASSPDKDKGSSDAETPVSRTNASSRLAFSATNDYAHRQMDVDFDAGGGRSRPVSSIAETASVTSEGSQQFSSALSAWDGSSIGSSQRRVKRPPPPDLRHQIQKLPTDMRGSVGSLDDMPIRTSHAEAFATLEPPFIEYLRQHTEKYDGASDHDSQPSRFKGLRKLFHPQPLKGASKHSPQGPGTGNVAVLEGHYTPPWLTMAARSKQEEQERVIKNLNDSFRDVGLLPSFKPNKNRQNKKGKRSSDNVFDQIPDDSLYMLLPMWPGETDPTSAALEDDSAMEVDIPIHERQYLLVYYVPNELSKDKKPDDKKRTRGSHTSSAASHHSEVSTARSGADGKGGSGGGGTGNGSGGKNSVCLSSFNVLARLVSYKDVNGSGIRVPTNGLAVTGPMSDAIAAIPQVRFQVDDLALMIAFCASRERGVEVVPEGSEKLGLCVPRTNFDDPDSDAPLSPLGRAAVEMAWLGALAIMGFETVAGGGAGSGVL
ncbi:hypothetical protein A7U60_g5472 [Sanghuangporus baumii]|uniref:Uncharacterized protein n=1 Tax=Sanghuangporus baumii TaxID=108892 RepID=A0A9Q5N875_SANBA|nr:hypothetical protein A7U60_g5472 [Sanghuangporus baumii]